ncbi:hypothetical protein BU24DRAFT_254393 [Aaosphaeria arxii CBS 175.79]|uniref:Uncharacterized protein n=1 Tax=Aaosphaeria arxii CBS 175.79 TaxID=1450172 RepID=A0A6A5XH47_9PLEO|nr:uncharacterized protein BU24DRAFT_254393 [Aaosphaeria arxii CBS 175.79]KAF2012565.1 hypothetical protein BU24DRAFT_254393 [Aaosphaeria arxii CBS 175.79]
MTWMNNNPLKPSPYPLKNSNIRNRPQSSPSPLKRTSIPESYKIKPSNKHKPHTPEPHMQVPTIPTLPTLPWRKSTRTCQPLRQPHPSAHLEHR